MAVAASRVGETAGWKSDAAHVCVHVSVCRDGVEFATARECERNSLPLCLLCGRVAEVRGLLDKCQKGFSYWFSRAAFLPNDRLKVTVGQRNRVFVHLSFSPHHRSAALQLLCIQRQQHRSRTHGGNKGTADFIS